MMSPDELGEMFAITDEQARQRTAAKGECPRAAPRGLTECGFMRPKIPICPVETTPKSTVEQGESRPAETPRLVWRRLGPGLYLSGDVEITRQDARYGPLWRIDTPTRPANRIRGQAPSLRAAKALAERAQAVIDAGAAVCQDVAGRPDRAMTRARRRMAFQEL